MTLKQKFQNEIETESTASLNMGDVLSWGVLIFGEGQVKRGLPDHEAKDLGGEAPTGFDNKSNGIVDDANPPGRSRSIGPP
jgi:hypothetical protein